MGGLFGHLKFYVCGVVLQVLDTNKQTFLLSWLTLSIIIVFFSAFPQKNDPFLHTKKYSNRIQTRQERLNQQMVQSRLQNVTSVDW